MRQRARVVEVEGVPGLVADVGARPLGGITQVRASVPPEHAGGQRDLGRAELHVVAPGVFGVEGVRESRGELLGRAGGVRLRVEELRLTKLATSSGGVPLRVDLGCESERGGDAADEVGADLGSRRGRTEHRPVRDVAVEVAREAVVALRQPPEVVVAAEGAGLVARADADLHVEGLAIGVPHLVEPRQPVPGLLLDGLRRAPAEHPLAQEEQDVVVGAAVGELEVVAGIGPAAGSVERSTEPVQVVVGHRVGVGQEVRPCVDLGVVVVEVSRLAVECTGNDIGAVALHLVELDPFPQERAVDRAGAGDPEVRRTRVGRRPGPRCGSDPALSGGRRRGRTPRGSGRSRSPPVRGTAVHAARRHRSHPPRRSAPCRSGPRS